MKNTKKAEHESSQDSSDYNPEELAAKLVKKRLRKHSKNVDDKQKEDEED